MHRVIVFADIVGYSTLVETAEEETLVRSSHALGLIARTCKARGGVVCQLLGDDTMLAFGDSPRAVSFAADVQGRLRRDPIELSNGEQIVLRFGVHLGSVTPVARSYRGHTVNVAKRVQSEAAPGGVCITAQVLGDLPDTTRRERRIEDKGYFNFKGISEPFRLYEVAVHGGPPAGELPTAIPGLAVSGSSRDYDTPPRVVVSPLRQHLDTPGLAPMASALTDELVSQFARRGEILLHSPGLFADDPHRMDLMLRLCRSHGIDYLIDGVVSPDAAGFRVRADLIGCSSAQILCSTHFPVHHDERLRDIVCGSANAALKMLGTMLTAESSGVINDRNPRGLYDRFLYGQKLAHTLDEEANAEAIHVLEALVDANGEHAQALVELAHARHMAWRYDWGERPQHQLDAAIEAATRATAVDPTNAATFSELGFALIFADDIAASMEALDTAFDLNPQDPWVMANLSDAHVHAGNMDRGLDLLQQSLALNATLQRDWRIWSLAEAHFFRGDYEAVVKNVKRMNDWTQGSRLAAASLGLMDRTQQATRYVERVLETQPGFTVGDWARKHPSTSAERLVNPLSRGMLAAGLPK